MIRCQNCGAQLGLLDEKCPYCGTLNEHAQKHVALLKEYSNDYDETKKEVHQKVHSYSKVYGLLATLLILVLTFLVLCIILGNSYELFSQRQLKEFKENETLIMDTLNDYIENQDYERFTLYYEDVTDAIYSLEYDALDQYYYLVSQYIRLKENLYNHFHADDTYVDYASNVLDSAKWFFDDYLRIYPSNPYYKEAELVYKEVQDLLKVYLNIDEESFEALKRNEFADLNEVIYRGIYEK